MLLFCKPVDEIQIPQSQEYTDTFKQNLTCIFLPIRANLKYTLCHEGPCTTGYISQGNMRQFNLPNLPSDSLYGLARSFKIHSH